MSFKTTYWLFGILLVIVGVVGLALYLDPLPANLDAFVFPDENKPRAELALDKIHRVQLERTNPPENLVLARDEKYDLWRMKEPVVAEADSVRVEDLIRRTVQAKRELNREPGNPAKLGLEPPQAVLTLGVLPERLLPERDLKLEIGDTTFGTTDAVIYVRSSQRPEVCVMPKNDIDIVLKSAAYFRKRELLTTAPSDILSVKLTHVVDGKPRDATVELIKDKDRWVYRLPVTGEANNLSSETKIEPGQAPTNIATLLDQLTKLQVAYTDEKDNDFVASNVSDWKTYGLDSTGNLLTVEIKRADKAGKDAKAAGTGTTQTVVIAVGKRADEKSDKYFARREGEANVVKVPGAPVSILQELLLKPESLRERRLLTLDNERRIPNVIFIKNPANPAEDLEFFKRERGWQLYRSGATTPSAVDEGVVKGFLSLVGQDRMIEGFPDLSKTSEASLGLDNPTRIVSFWLDGIEVKKPAGAEEGKDDPNAKPKLKVVKPTARLLFGKRDATKKTVFVKREEGDDPPGVFEVRDVLFDRIAEGALAFLDTSLPGFRDGADNATLDVTNVTILNKGTTTTVARANDKAPWKIVLPKNLEGRAVDPDAIGFVLGTLNQLKAGKYVADNPTPEQLARTYGLGQPESKVTITVTKDNKPAVYEILFGKDAAEGGGIFAKLAGAYQNNLVFTLDKRLLTLFERDLLDPTVFRFTPAKVKEISFRGWFDVNKKVLPLELIRKDATTWEAKKTPFQDPYVVNSVKVQQFLEVLSRLRADRFIAHGKQPEASHGLHVQNNGLSIWLTLEGEDKPRTLMLGKLEGNGYFATSSELPDDIFLVNKNFVEGLKESVAYFEK